MRIRMLGIVAAAVAVAGMLSAGPDRPADAAVPATIPFTITNNSGRGDAVYIYNLGTNPATG
ncbi:MAG: sugar hydrolase, partial [Kribbellaceae bacterium]|nr:sugar hydrolase [Kribbellaceae bacterium]